MGKWSNKWTRAAIPALLIHCSIGMVYCWSYFKADIAHYIGAEKASVEWAFSLAIFFLGMSAAFAGDIVEKNVKVASTISMIFFNLGLVLTGLFVHLKFLPGILLSYGVIMGIGLGIGYLSPVKTLMLWFKEKKGLATGIAVAGFGLAKVIATPLIELFEEKLCGPRDAEGFLIDGSNLWKVFLIFAAIYTVLMFIGRTLLKKPEGWEESHDEMKILDYIKKPLSLAGGMFKKPVFLGIWLMFYLNIACGLALISQEKDIYAAIGFDSYPIFGIITVTFATMGSVTAMFNAGGRLFYSATADKLKDRNTIYKFIFILSIVAISVNVIFNSIENSIIPLVLILMCIVNANYGGGFSNVPTLLADRYGMKAASKVHGLVLTAWAIAGLTGNQISAQIVKHASDQKQGFRMVLIVVGALYLLALIFSFVLVRPVKEDID